MAGLVLLPVLGARLLPDFRENYLIAHAALRPGISLQETSRIGERIAVRLAAIHRPDIAVLDLAMPRLDGLGAARQIRMILPNIAIAIVTMHAGDAFAGAAREAGANAYLQKSGVELHLLPVISALAGQRHSPPGLNAPEFLALPTA